MLKRPVLIIPFSRILLSRSRVSPVIVEAFCPTYLLPITIGCPVSIPIRATLLHTRMRCYMQPGLEISDWAPRAPLDWRQTGNSIRCLVGPWTAASRPERKLLT
ncbi:hypothetical protein BDW72DRAFT_129445 [Aspergillus terricola var. indicus]